MTVPTVAEAAAALRAGALTSVALTRACLAAMDAAEPRLGAVLTRFDEAALAAAAAADDAFAAGTDRGPLQGIPVAVKDLLTSREAGATAQSAVPQRYRDRRVDAGAVARLRSAGAVIVAKATLNEFAVGAPDPAAGFPVPRNPWDLDRWPGGSSSGSGAGVAAGLFPAALGSDTGGSIRIPAALCGISGLKPTYGLVPVDGCVPFAPSLDTVGPMARTAVDCGMLLAALAPGLAPAGPGDGLAGLRVGVARGHAVDAGSDPAVLELFDDAVGVLADAGARVGEVALPDRALADAATAVLTQVEAFAAHRADLAAHWRSYGSFTRLLLSHGVLYTGADYVQAERICRRLRAEVSGLFERYDVLVSPTVGALAPAVDSDLTALMPLFLTGLWNTTGHPALSVPMGFARGLPAGLQLVGRPHADASLVAAGAAYQERTDWHQRRPPAVGA